MYTCTHKYAHARAHTHTHTHIHTHTHTHTHTQANFMEKRNLRNYRYAGQKATHDWFINSECFIYFDHNN